MKVTDQNDRLRAGTLPDDPKADTVVVSEEVTRIYGEKDLLNSVNVTSDKRIYGTTGNAKLDEATGGMRPEDVWMVGADTSWGKSSFAVRLYDENLKRKKKVLIVSGEDSMQTYGARLLRRRTRVPAATLRGRTLSREQHDAVSQARKNAISNASFIDARGKTVEWLAPQIKRAVSHYGIDIVCFDYVGAFACKAGSQDRRNMVTYIARVMADVAKTAGVCGVIFSQITPGKAGKDGDKYALRDSNDLVQMAEVMLLGTLAEKDHAEGKYREGDRLLKVTKCKEGEAGKTHVLAWDSEVACFDTEWSEEQVRDQNMVELTEELTGSWYDNDA
jgi:replicative DNA helicase